MKKFFKHLIIYFLLIPFFLSLGIVNCNATSHMSVDTRNLAIYSSASLLIEKETGDILYEKNAYEKMYPASTTKILTAILVLEKCYLNEMVTVSTSALANVPPSYTSAELQAGEEIRVIDLLYAMLIPSGNDAANVLAEHVSGSIAAFADLMNKKASEIGLTNSHFTNPSGIHDPNLYSTAFDLSLLAKYAMSIEKFRDIVKTDSYTLPPTNLHPNADRSFHNSNLLIVPSEKNYYYNFATGIKTGFTDPAGDCLVASAKKDDIEFIAVCLKSGTTESGLREKFLDCKTLFNFAFDNYTTYYSELQEKIKENEKNPDDASPTENILSDAYGEVSEQIKNLDTDSYRFLIKVTAILIILLAIYLLFFRKKKNRYKRFRRKR